MLAGVLLVPEEGDPLGLLRDGPHGERPPMACWDGERWRSWADNGWWWPVVPGRQAIVLAWVGVAVAGGACRIETVLYGLDGGGVPSWRLISNRSLRVLEGNPGAFRMLNRMLNDLGTVVRCDEAGVEVPL